MPWAASASARTRASRGCSRTTWAAAASSWELHLADARAAFPEQLGDVDAETFWRGVNRVRPGFIRVEADELTYDFHIMLRVEIEAALVDGSLSVKDLPEAWNAKIKEYFGLDVPSDRLGVLQDVHWSSGQIGRPCNYTIGNVMAGQLFASRARGRGGGRGAGDRELYPDPGMADRACAPPRQALHPRRVAGALDPVGPGIRRPTLRT